MDDNIKKDEMHREEGQESPSNSHQTISDDDEIDYSIKPEFYDSDLDDKDELWVQKKRSGRTSDAILSCPACFTTLCLDCQRHTAQLFESDRDKARSRSTIRLQIENRSPVTFGLQTKQVLFLRHEKNVTQYRAIFVVNCKIKSEIVAQLGSKRKRGKKGRGSCEAEAVSDTGEIFKHVCCSVCSTEVGVIDEEEVYHFFNVLPSET